MRVIWTNLRGSGHGANGTSYAGSGPGAVPARTTLAAMRVQLGTERITSPKENR
jgi:hypothetical protein